MRFRDILVDSTGFKGHDGGLAFSANFPLFLIGEARGQGCNFEDLCDGFGPGKGSHGDWSGIRDSTNGAIDKMLERALNHLFGQRGY